MKPRTALALVSIVSIAWVAFAVAVIWPTPARGQPATAASAPAIVPTACGEAGVGRLVGRAEPVARSASEAAGSYVNNEGYWATPCPLIVTPDTECGAPAVGRVDGRGVERAQRPGRRVDASGRWVDCDRACPPAQPMASRTWSAGENVCTTHSPDITSSTDHRLDRTIRHGQSEMWAQTTGRMRGMLIERCEDGRRVTVLSRCVPVTRCDTRIEATRGGNTYVYDGVRKPVPLGSSVTLRAADGSTWPATCVDGSWDAPSVLPRPPAPPAARPETVVGCRSGVTTVIVDRKVRRYRIDGPARPAGAEVLASGLLGAPDTTLVCDGSRWVRPTAPVAPRPPSSESAAEEWLRLFRQQEAATRQ